MTRRVQVHDFGGYAFQADLSRHLSDEGWKVQHAYSPQYSSNIGDFEERLDGSCMEFLPVVTSVPAAKYDLIGRFRFEWAYGGSWIAAARAYRPDVVVAANVPLVALARFAAWARRSNTPWLLWHQDVVSVAMSDELRRRFPAPAALVGGALLQRLEARLVEKAGGIVPIGDAFLDVYAEWGSVPKATRVVPNWAPLRQITPMARRNPWSDATYSAEDHLPRLLYAGTLGKKHRPMLLVDLCRALSAAGCPVHLTVVSEGPDARRLEAVAGSLGGSRLTVLPFQPASDLPQVLASADVLVAVLEPAAARFSIPSKILSYLAAGRPVLGLIPDGNGAAVDVSAAGGLVVPPDAYGISQAVPWLVHVLESPAVAAEIGASARAWAAERFDGGKNAAAIAEMIGWLVTRAGSHDESAGSVVRGEEVCRRRS